LAVSIKDKFGFMVKLKEGHDAIFKVTMGGTVIFYNDSKCGQLPINEDIIKWIEKLQ
jgi:hypothetical protein